MTPSLILRITDTISGRTAALRLDDPAAPEAPLGCLLERYLKDAPNDDRLMRTGAVATDGLLLTHTQFARPVIATPHLMRG
jgi:hypothetical protein